MNIDEIIERHEQLDKELKNALSVMERSDKIKSIRMQIVENQRACPHFSEKYNWTIAYGRCPYCGFVFDEGREY